MSASRSGELAKRALPALLLDFADEFATGKLTLRRGGMLKVFHIVSGNLMGPAMAPSDQALRQVMVSEKLVTEAQAIEALAFGAKNNKRFGESLVAIGALSIEKLFDQLRREARRSIAAALRWPQGSWTFEPKVETPAGTALRTTDVVLLGLQEAPSTDLDRLAQLDAYQFALNERGTMLAAELAKVFGSSLLAALDGWHDMNTLGVAAGSSMVARAAVDAMLLCDALQMADRAVLPTGGVTLATNIHAASRAALAPRPDAMPATSTGALAQGSQGGLALVDDDDGEDDFSAMPTQTRAPSELLAAHLRGVGHRVGMTPAQRAKLPSRPPGNAAGNAPGNAAGNAAGDPPAADPSVPPRTITSPMPAASVAPGPTADTPVAKSAVRATGASSIVPASVAKVLPPLAGPAAAATAPAAVAASASTAASASASASAPAPAPAPAAAPAAALVSTPGARPSSQTGVPVPAAPSALRKSGTILIPRPNVDAVDEWFAANTQRTANDAVPTPMPVVESGAVPIAVYESALQGAAELSDVKQRLTAEWARVRAGDHYAVLMVARNASDAEIAAAAADRKAEFSPEVLVQFELGPDKAKLASVLKAYRQAEQALLDRQERARYNQTLADTPAVEPTEESDAQFQRARELIGNQHWEQATSILIKLTQAAGEVPAYLAELGWVLWHHHGKQGRAVDNARGMLHRALAADPDCARAHEYLGMIEAASGQDPQTALYHLETALAHDPQCRLALDELEHQLVARGDLRRLEKVLQRLVLQQGTNTDDAALIWLRLAQLYKVHLGQNEAAQTAVARALALAPHDPHVMRAQRWVLPEVSSSEIRVRTQPRPSDHSWLVAAVAVASGAAAQAQSQLYIQHRRGLATLPTRPLSYMELAALRHPNDFHDIEDLVGALAPVIRQLAPMSLADAQLSEASKLVASPSNEAARLLVQRLTMVLGLPPVAIHVDGALGSMVQPVAVDQPTIVMGPDALATSDNAEQVFYVTRALWLTTPARAIGGSRQGRVLRAAATAALSAATSSIVDADELAVQASVALRQLDADAQSDVIGCAKRMLAKRRPFNLSTWAKALPRTAERVGLLLCGDPVVAQNCVTALGESDPSLLEFAVSDTYQQLRDSLGIAL